MYEILYILKWLYWAYIIRFSTMNDNMKREVKLFVSTFNVRNFSRKDVGIKIFFNKTLHTSHNINFLLWYSNTTVQKIHSNFFRLSKQNLFEWLMLQIRASQMIKTTTPKHHPCRHGTECLQSWFYYTTWWSICIFVLDKV